MNIDTDPIMLDAADQIGTNEAIAAYRSAFRLVRDMVELLSPTGAVPDEATDPLIEAGLLSDAITKLARVPGVHMPVEDMVGRWCAATFGERIYRSRWERAMRLAEEAIELAQAEQVAEVDALELVRHVYGRPVGDPVQEAAGVAVCLYAYGGATGLPIMRTLLRELARVEHMDPARLRSKQALKAEKGLSLDPEPML